MTHAIDLAYIRDMIALPDGDERILAWITRLIEDRDVAREIAKTMARDRRSATPS